MRATLTGTLALAAALGLVAAGCGGAGEARVSERAAPAKPVSCKYEASWQKLANRIGAAVYCPNWLPDPLHGRIGDRTNNVDAVDPDRSYLMSFVWQDTDGPNLSGELHVNLRGYPGRTKIPTCTDTIVGSGGKVRRPKLPCFADPQQPHTVGGIRVTPYTVNQDADQWHLLYLWRHDGGLYTVSEHVAPPLTFSKVKRYLDRIVRNLVLVEPQQG